MNTNITLRFRSFESQILYFNGMYKLPVSSIPSLDAVLRDEAEKDPVIEAGTAAGALLRRLQAFKKTLSDEVAEVEDILNAVTEGSKPAIDILVELADWLGDIQIYCASEMTKFGIPIKETLDIIMASNFSKLGENGKPIYNADGKVMKGPGYWKPEPLLKEMLQKRIEE